MSALTRLWRSFRFLCLFSVAVVAISPALLVAENPAEKLSGSLKFIPATASSYSASLRNREVFDNVINSKAWKAFMEMPAVKQAWDALQDQLDGPLGEVENFFDDPLNQDLLKVLVEMVSEEIFLYTDERMPDWIRLYQTVNSARMFSPLGQLFGGADPATAQLKGMLDALNNQRDKLIVPHFVVGFKIKDAEKARIQLKRLELLIGFLPLVAPQLKFNHETIAGTDYLTIAVDGSAIPWDDLPLADLEEKPGQYQPLVEKLKTLKFTLGLGVRENYIILSLGAPVTALEKFGQGPKLADLSEFKKLAPFADRRVTSVGYSSGGMRDASGSAGEQWRSLREQLEQLADKGAAFGLPKELGERMRADLKKLTALETPIKHSPELSLGFFAPHGFENYTFDWTDANALDGSQRLSLLEHVGGTPIAFSVSRTKPSVGGYDTFVELLKVGHKYFEDFAVPNFEDEEKEIYRKVMQSLTPLLARIDKTTREKLFPALADGQSGIVLDAQIKSKQWILGLPHSTPLPMLELGLIHGLNNRDQLLAAGSELRDAANDFLSQLDQFDTPLQLMRIPEPKVKELENGKQYAFPWPEGWGLDKQLAPNFGVSQKMLTFSTSMRQTDRLLKPTPLKMEGILADTQRPLAAASYFSFAGLVDAGTPWIELAARYYLSGGELGPLGLGLLLADDNSRPKIQRLKDDPPEVKEVLDQVQTALDILKCFRSTASVTYRDANVWIRHGETIFQDLP